MFILKGFLGCFFCANPVFTEKMARISVKSHCSYFSQTCIIPSKLIFWENISQDFMGGGMVYSSLIHPLLVPVCISATRSVVDASSSEDETPATRRQRLNSDFVDFDLEQTIFPEFQKKVEYDDALNCGKGRYKDN